MNSSTSDTDSNKTEAARFKRILTRAIILPQVLLAVLVGVFLWQITRLLDTAGLVEHTIQVISRATNAQKLLLDMESGFRGFVITGDEAFLEPYNQALPQIEPALTELRRLVSDSPAQVSTVNNLSSQHQDWARYAREVIAQRKTNGEYQARVSSGEGKRILDSMRADFATFVEREEALRATRVRASRQAAIVSVVSGLAAGLLLGAILAIFIRYQLLAASESYRRALNREQEHREWLATTLSSLGDAVVATDAKGIVTLMNGVAESLTGWTSEEALGQPLVKVFRVLNEDSKTEAENPVTRVLRDGQIVGLANHSILISKDGGQIPIDDSGAPIRLASGEITGVVLVFRDISERKQTEAALLESELRLRQAVIESPIPTIIHDESGVILEMSKGWTHESGYRLDDIPTMIQWKQRSSHKMQSPSKEAIDDLFESHETLSEGEQLITAKDGSRHVWDYFTTPLGKSRRGTRLMLTTAIDVTERRKAEQESEILFEREKTLRKDAERANELKDEFLANASHELRTPLNAIVGWIRMLRTGSLDAATTASAMETIDRSAQTQTRLIEDLLDMSRILGGKVALDLQPIDVIPVVSAAVNSLTPSASAKEISIKTISDDGLLPVVADPTRVQQIVWNLLSNAIKFTPRGGRVAVILRKGPAHLEISVTDTGEGIKPEFLPHVFERFRQADGSKTRRHGGLGLGLAIVRHLVELQGGTVSAASEGVHKGATFSVRFPVDEYKAEVGSGQRPPSGSGDPIDLILSSQRPKLGGIRVLVVDDDAASREMLSAVLLQCDANVVTAGSTSEALIEIDRQRPDLLVSDIGMPGQDGYELIRKLRLLESSSEAVAIPAMALTAYARSEDRVRSLNAGYHAHLSKPVDPEEFVLLAANLINRSNL